jgi:hypothetical protein
MLGSTLYQIAIEQLFTCVRMEIKLRPPPHLGHLSQETGYPGYFCDFPQSLHENAGVKWLDREADLSSPSSTEIKNT